MIDRPAIIITSLGRTGTKFLYTLFKGVLPDSTVLHEPDILNVVQYRGASERIRQVFRQIREAGVYNMLVRKPLGRWSLFSLSDARVRGQLDYDEAVRQVLSQRKGLVGSKETGAYVEANAGYYGLVDVLSDVYMHHRLVFIIRDGREWVRSWMNWGQAYGGLYGKGRIGRVWGHNWLTAAEVKGDPYAEKWRTMSKFERVCWAWARLNGYALETTRKNSSSRLFHFEDVFESDDRYHYLAELVDFATDMPGVSSVLPEAFEGWLERGVHESSGRFPAWSDWSAEHKQQFIEICGPLMEVLSYGIT